MLTLILNGSPRKNGDTARLIEALKSGLRGGTGDIIEVTACDADIKSCIDCRFCWHNPGCALDDDMQRVYGLIEKADNIVIASPVYFSEITGPLLGLASRLQRYYAYKRFSGGESPVMPGKKGAVLLCGGGEGAPDRARETAELLLRCMRAEKIYCAMSLNTDTVPTARDAAALENAREIGCALCRE